MTPGAIPPPFSPLVLDGLPWPVGLIAADAAAGPPRSEHEKRRPSAARGGPRARGRRRPAPGGPAVRSGPSAAAAAAGDAKICVEPDVPLNPLYKTRLCTFFASDACRHGPTCPFAHGEADLRKSPDFERTSVCPTLLKFGECLNAACRYAHKAEDLRRDDGLLKTQMCRYYLNGQCVVGSACRFAHSPDELQQALSLRAAAASVGASNGIALSAPVPVGAKGQCSKAARVSRRAAFEAGTELSRTRALSPPAGLGIGMPMTIPALSASAPVSVPVAMSIDSAARSVPPLKLPAPVPSLLGGMHATFSAASAPKPLAPSVPSTARDEGEEMWLAPSVQPATAVEPLWPLGQQLQDASDNAVAEFAAASTPTPFASPALVPMPLPPGVPAVQPRRGRSAERTMERKDASNNAVAPLAVAATLTPKPSPALKPLPLPPGVPAVLPPRGRGADSAAEGKGRRRRRTLSASTRVLITTTGSLSPREREPAAVWRRSPAAVPAATEDETGEKAGGGDANAGVLRVLADADLDLVLAGAQAEAESMTRGCQRWKARVEPTQAEKSTPGAAVVLDIEDTCIQASCETCENNKSTCGGDPAAAASGNDGRGHAPTKLATTTTTTLVAAGGTCRGQPATCAFCRSGQKGACPVCERGIRVVARNTFLHVVEDEEEAAASRGSAKLRSRSL